jgi:hypothetical protein
MLGTTQSITYNAVAKVLSRIADDGFSAQYYLDGGTEKFTLTVRHSIPGRGGSGEAHTAKLDVDHYDANGVFLRQVSSWLSMKTFENVQDKTSSTRCTNALVGWATTTIVGNLADRES